MPATDGGTEHREMSIVYLTFFEKFWSIRDFVGCYCWSFHFIGLTYTNIVYHYIHVYYICFVPKSWVFHGIQGHTSGATHVSRWCGCGLECRLDEVADGGVSSWLGVATRFSGAGRRSQRRRRPL